VTTDAERFQFNTSISRLMELLNALNKYQALPGADFSLLRDVTEDLLRLMAPFAPHFCEESWQQLGHNDSIFHEAWPVFDPAALVRDTIEIAIQVNGSVKYRLDIPSDATAADVEAQVLSDDRTKALLTGRQLVKVIFVPGRLANLVVR
jgi:leucyl-tRNA synthetase